MKVTSRVQTIELTVRFIILLSCRESRIWGIVLVGWDHIRAQKLVKSLVQSRSGRESKKDCLRESAQRCKISGTLGLLCRVTRSMNISDAAFRLETRIALPED